MNFLAHAYLSFNHPELLVGNMISDFVKGKKKFDYSEGIQNGIMLHRAIDIFTDAHAATKEARLFFKPAVGAYSGAFVDVAYDHYLANDSNEFGDGDLSKTVQNAYQILNGFEPALPFIFRQMLPYMTAQNWLYNYKNTDGIAKSFEGVARRATYLESGAAGFVAFEKNYKPLQDCYKVFFPELKAFTLRHIQQLALQ